MNSTSIPPAAQRPTGLPAASNSESPLSPVLLARALRKNWPLTVLALALFLAGASFYTSRVTRVYEAVATVQLDPQPLMPLGNQTGKESGPESFWSNQEYFATQHQILVSRRVAAMVVHKLGLTNDAAFITGAPPDKPVPPMTISADTAAEIVRGRLDVKQIADSRLTRVTYRDANPSRAQKIVAAVVDAYVEQNLDRSLDSANQRAEWLDTQLGKLKVELESQEMELHDFKKRNNLLSVSYDDQSNMLRAQIQQLNSALTELKAKQETVTARLAVLREINPDDPANIPQSELLGGSSLTALRAGYIDAKGQLERLVALGKGQNHPEVQAANAAVRQSHDALVAELENIKKGVAADLDAVHRELGGVTRLYDAAKVQAMDLNLNEVRFARLRRSKDNTEHMFGQVLERSTESGMSKLMPFNNVRVLDRPLLPTVPVVPRTGMNLAFGGILGLLVGLAFAVGRELLDRTVRDVEDVEQELGIAPMGSLPDVSGRAGRGAYYHSAYRQRGGRMSEAPRKTSPDVAEEPKVPELLVHSHPHSAAAEAARAIRTNLLLMSPDHPYKTILVTSAGPSEGKTMVTASIAIAMAQAGQRVCLIDCDLRRPRVHNIFGLSAELGVTVATLDNSRLDDALRESTVPNLSVLCAGPMPPNPADLMHSDAFRRLLDSVKARFDRVVIDSPPVCLVTDSVVLSTQVDATLLVVRARKTRRDAARRALRALDDVGAKVPGFILNAGMPWGDSYNYSYYRPYVAQPADGES